MMSGARSDDHRYLHMVLLTSFTRIMQIQARYTGRNIDEVIRGGRGRGGVIDIPAAVACGGGDAGLKRLGDMITYRSGDQYV